MYVCALRGDNVSCEGYSLSRTPTLSAGPICFEEFEVGQVISYSANPSCGHVFHHECIKVGSILSFGPCSTQPTTCLTPPPLCCRPQEWLGQFVLEIYLMLVWKHDYLTLLHDCVPTCLLGPFVCVSSSPCDMSLLSQGLHAR